MITSNWLVAACSSSSAPSNVPITPANLTLNGLTIYWRIPWPFSQDFNGSSRYSAVGLCGCGAAITSFKLATPSPPSYSPTHFRLFYSRPRRRLKASPQKNPNAHCASFVKAGWLDNWKGQLSLYSLSAEVSIISWSSYCFVESLTSWFFKFSAVWGWLASQLFSCSYNDRMVHTMTWCIATFPDFILIGIDWWVIRMYSKCYGIN